MMSTAMGKEKTAGKAKSAVRKLCLQERYSHRELQTEKMSGRRSTGCCENMQRGTDLTCEFT